MTSRSAISWMLTLCLIATLFSSLVAAESAADKTIGGITYNDNGVIIGFENKEPYSLTTVRGSSVGGNITDKNSVTSNSTKVGSTVGGITRNKSGKVTNVSSEFSNTTRST